MSDNKDSKGQEQGPENGDPEILSPGKKKTESGKARAEDPRIIDGEAEEVKEGAGETSGSRPGPVIAPVIGAGIGGGLIGAVALGAFLHFSGGLPVPGNGEAPDEARLTALESRINAATDFARDETSGLGERLGDVEERLAGFDTGQAERVEELSASLEALEGALSDMRRWLDETASGTREALAALDARTDDLQEQSDSLRAQLPPPGLMEKIGAGERRLDALETGVGALGPQVGALSGQVAALTERVNEPSGAEKAALGAAFAGLARAFEAGRPFSGDLQALSEITGPRDDIAALGAAAQRGVPSLETLRGRFADLAPRVLKAERTEGADGFWTRLAANASTLVTIRRKGELEGDGAEAVLARMERRLEEGDLAGAVETGAALEGAAAEAASAWMADAQARLQAEALIADLNSLVMREIAAGG